jgi:tRNA pseudouridine38-40 synthase
VTVEGAGRTDAGVHARGQVIAFTYRGRLGRSELHQALAASLPADIGLGPIVAVEPGFHPRHRARYREYRYLIWNGPRSPLRERQALGVRARSTAAMAAAAGLLAGTASPPSAERIASGAR